MNQRSRPLITTPAPARQRRPRVAATLLIVAFALAAHKPENRPELNHHRITPAVAPASFTINKERNALDAYGKLALAFIPNAGQTDSRVRYWAHGGGASFFFTPSEAVVAFTSGKRGLALRLSFLGANPLAQLTAERRNTGTINYLVGSDPKIIRRHPGPSTQQSRHLTSARCL